MTKTVIHLVVLALVLLLAQVVCSKVMLLGVAMPIVFIYVLLRLPVSLHLNWVFTIAFVLGVVVDVFNDTPGMNALSCVLTAALRYHVFMAYAPRDIQQEGLLPSMVTIGVAAYVKYAFTLVLFYAIVLFLTQAFTLRDWLLTAERVGASTLVSVVLILGIDSLVDTSHEEGL